MWYDQEPCLIPHWHNEFKLQQIQTPGQALGLSIYIFILNKLSFWQGIEKIHMYNIYNVYNIS